MCSLGIIGEGELRGQLSDAGSPGGMAVKTVCVCHSLAEGLSCLLRRTFTGAQDQFWPDALPASTNGSYWYQLELNPALLDASPLP